MRHLPFALLVALITGCAGAASAQDLRDFCAQRPGRATPPCVLDAGHLQLEVGLDDTSLQRYGGPDEEVDSLLSPELRYGLTKRLEVEVSASPYVVDRVSSGGGHSKGTGDTTLGLLRALTDPDQDGGVAVSVLGFVTAPTATHGLGAGGWTGGVKLPVAAPLGGGVSLGLTPEIDVLRDAAGGGTHLSYVGVGSLGRSFGPLTLGVELWGQIEDEPTGRIKRATADLTAAWMIGKSMQLDAGAAFGLNHATPDEEVYVGISRRF